LRRGSCPPPMPATGDRCPRPPSLYAQRVSSGRLTL